MPRRWKFSSTESKQRRATPNSSTRCAGAEASRLEIAARSRPEPAAAEARAASLVDGSSPRQNQSNEEQRRILRLDAPGLRQAASRTPQVPGPGMRPTRPERHASSMEVLLDRIKATKSNAEFFDSMRRG